MARAIVLFTLTLTALVMAGVVQRAVNPDVGRYFARAADSLPGPEWYVAVDENQIAWEHYIHYLGYGDAIENAAAADVVIVGSSRSQWAFDRDLFTSLFASSGLRVYNLGLGHNEPVPFFQTLIERHNLRPRFLVVFVDTSPWVRSGTRLPSLLAEKIVSEGPWAATRYTYSGLAMRWVKDQSRSLLPYFLVRPPIIYRNWRDGFWYRSFVPGKGTPIEETADIKTDQQRAVEQELLTDFTRRMEARGIRVIFAWVPAPHSSRERARQLAEIVDAPLIAPPEGSYPFTTLDASHLDTESAVQFTQVFHEQFMAIIGGPSGR